MSSYIAFYEQNILKKLRFSYCLTIAEGEVSKTLEMSDSSSANWPHILLLTSAYFIKCFIVLRTSKHDIKLNSGKQYLKVHSISSGFFS